MDPVSKSALTTVRPALTVVRVTPEESELILKAPDQYHKQNLERLMQELREGVRSGSETSIALTELRDRIVSSVVDHCFKDYPLKNSISLIAIGGTADKTCCPHSDYDSIYLIPDHLAPDEPDFSKRRYQADFLIGQAGFYWDHQAWQAGFLPNIANLKEQERLNAVLTRRLIWGEKTPLEELEKNLVRFVQGSSHGWGPNLEHCLELLEQLNSMRFRDKGDDPLALYGDKKNGRGGYRCMTVIRAYAEYAKLSGRGIEELDLLNDEEWNEFTRAREVVLALRHALHQTTPVRGTSAEVLTTRNEEAVMNAVPWLCRNERGECGRVVLHEKIVSSRRTFNELLKKIQVALTLQTDSERRPYDCLKDIHEELYVFLSGDQELSGPNPHAARASLAAKCVEAFAKVQELKREQQLAGKEKRLSKLDQNAILNAAVLASVVMQMVEEENGRKGDKEERSPNPFLSPEAIKQFRTIISRTGYVGATLHSLHDKEILSYLLPVFGSIQGKVGERVADHSLDGHLLAAVSVLDRIKTKNEPLLSQYLESVTSTTQIAVEDPAVLYLALLLHDIARVEGREKDRGEHARIGAKQAREAAISLAYTEKQADRVAKLIELHPELLETAQRHMVSKPNVVREFCEKVGDPDMLNMLLLHTWADKAASSSASWAEKGSNHHWVAMLYEASLRYMKEGNLGVLDNAQVIRELTRKLVPVAAITPTTAAIVKVYLWQHLTNLPKRYVEQCDMGEIGDHLKLLAELDSFRNEKNAPAALLKWDLPKEFETEGEEAAISTGAKSATLQIVTRDAPGLFSRICAGIGFNIRGAKIFTRHDGFVCNTFYLDVPAGYTVEELERGHNKGILDAITGDDALLAKVYAAQRALNQKISYHKMPVEVRYVDEEDYTRVEIRAADQGKLAFAMGRAFAEFGLSIRNAKLSLGSGGAEDFFEFDHIPEELRPRIAEALKLSIERLWNDISAGARPEA